MNKKRLTDEEFAMINKIAIKSKMDWFAIQQSPLGRDYVFDLEENERMSLVGGIDLLLQGVGRYVYTQCDLTTKEQEEILPNLLKRFNIKF